MGIDQLTEYGLKTAKGGLVFFLLSPDNLSDLSAEGVQNRVRALTDLLRSIASARDPALVHRIDPKSNEDYNTLKQPEKRVRDCGFHVRMAEDQDVKRFLAVYYQQDVTTERFDS